MQLRIDESHLDHWICGLMAENYEAVGFIPSTTVKNRYIPRGQYILQRDERGQRVGYLLHGPLKHGRVANVTQHCIQYERRLAGYGRKAFLELKRRCELANCSSIRLRVAEDLPGIHFWQSLGFEPVAICLGGQSRSRMIVSMVYPLALPLFVANGNELYCNGY